LNVNADTAAGAVAAAMKAEKLVIVSDTHGIRSDPKDPNSLVRSLNVNRSRNGPQRHDYQRHAPQGRGLRPRPQGRP